MSTDELMLISVDDHFAEPADMFEAHVPAKYKHLAPRAEPDGIQQSYYGEIRGRNMGLNAVAGKPREVYNVDAFRYDEAEAANEVKRLAHRRGCRLGAVFPVARGARLRPAFGLDAYEIPARLRTIGQIVP
jgi:hypothetical protein